MYFNEVRINNRLQIECENDNSTLRNVRGIVLNVTEKEIILITDYGQQIEIPEDKILSIIKINFDKYISDSLTEIKNHYNEIYEMEQKLKELKLNETELINKLFDANFLSKFNIEGAKNRLENSIDDSLLSFTKDNLTFTISFGANPNDQIELNIRVYNTFEYYNLNETTDVEKIIRVHAPNIKDVVEKCFIFKGDVMELDKKVVHEKDNIYNVSTLYKLMINVSQDNFLEVREEIKKGIERLKK